MPLKLKSNVSFDIYGLVNFIADGFPDLASLSMTAPPG